MLTRFHRNQKVRLSGLFGNRFDVDVVGLVCTMLSLELAGATQNDGGDLLRHSDRRLKLRMQMQDCDLSRIDGDGGDTRHDHRVRRVKLQR